MADSLRLGLGMTSTEDTSLVLPSDNKQCTGQQRVLQQVNSIKRSRSKIVRNDSIPSPTSPQSATEYSEPKFQFSPTTLNGSLFRKSSTNMGRWQSKMNGHSISLRKAVRGQTQSTSHCDSQINVQSASSGMKLSGSDPVLNRSGTLVTQKAVLSRAATVNVKPVCATQTVTKERTKSESIGMNGGTGAVPNITLQKAVEYLKHSEVSYKLCGASFIQHHTFMKDKAKHEVCQLRGIPALIQLLISDNSQLQQTAAAALRNIVFKDTNNKLMVKSCGGLEIILKALENTNETETQKQVTGLLWNLSSADELKPQLIRSGLIPLTENIVVPYNQWSDSNTNKHIDPEVFYNTTGCIRNLSCANEAERKLMRNCPGLIDSLMTYIQCQLERGEPDDKSLENCMCILHNLSYQLDEEVPEHFKQFTSDETKTENSKNKSLFSPKSPRKSKIQKQLSIPAMEDSDPKGVTWLYHTKALQNYLSLLISSQREGTLEACCGALQNLTASKNPVSTLMSETIAEKLNGLRFISPLLNSTNPGLQKTAMSLVGNMSRVESLRERMAKMVLPHVSSVLATGHPDVSKSENTIVTACRVMHTLTLAEPEHGKKVLNRNLIDSLSKLSSDMSSDSARRAAGVLLYSLWEQKDIHNTLKKQGLNKDTFINEVTAASYKLATGWAQK